jgi:1,4-dihydroxy-2-naphthoyl-CoA hydrolase
MINPKTPIEELNRINEGTMIGHLHIEYLEAGDGFVKARMPVNERTKQPMGILHGGANVALAETVGGLGSVLIVDPEEFDVRGSQISANHVGTAHTGWVLPRQN